MFSVSLLIPFLPGTEEMVGDSNKSYFVFFLNFFFSSSTSSQSSLYLYIPFCCIQVVNFFTLFLQLGRTAETWYHQVYGQVGDLWEDSGGGSVPAAMCRVLRALGCWMPFSP